MKKTIIQTMTILPKSLFIGLLLSPVFSFGQWNLITTQDTLYRYYDVAITPDTTVYICGLNYSNANGIVLRSHNLGSTWDTTTFLNECVDICFPTNSIGYVKSYPDNLYKTVDGGNTWNLISDSVWGQPSGDLLFINPDTGFSSFQDGGAGFYKTLDGGVTWTQMTDSSLGTGLELIGGREIVFNNGNLYVAGGAYFLKSSDYGVHWQAFFNDSSYNSFLSISVLNDTVWLAGIGAGGTPHFNYGIFSRSINGNTTWDMIENQDFYGYWDINMTNSHNGYLIGLGYDSIYRFLKTIDGGNNWCRQQCTGNIVYNSFYLFSVNCINDSMCFAVGDIGSIFRTLNGGGQLIDLSIPKIQNEIGLSLYPNPAIDIVNIDCVNKQNLSISIYNVIGELVLQKKLKNDKDEIDISFLTKGLYVVSVSSADWTVQKKLIKE